MMPSPPARASEPATLTGWLQQNWPRIAGIAAILLAAIVTIADLSVLLGTNPRTIRLWSWVLAPSALLLAIEGLFLSSSLLRRQRQYSLLRRVADALPHAEFVTDGAGRVLAANAGAELLLKGAPHPQDALSRMLAPDDDAGRGEIERLAAAAGSGIAADGQVQAPFGDGVGKALFRLRVTPLTEPHGATLWGFENITAEHQLRQMILQRRAVIDDFLDQVPVGLYSVDERGQFIWCNRTFARWIGLSSETIVGEGLKLSDFFPGDGSAPIGLDVFGTYSGRPLVLVNRMGERLTLELTQTVGQLGAMPSTCSMVRNAADADLPGVFSGPARRRFYRLFEGAPVGIALVDLAGRFDDTNPTIEKLLATETSGLRGRLFADFTHPDDHAAIEARIAAVTEDESIATPLEIRLKPPLDRTVALFVSRLGAGDGEVPGLILYVLDLTEQKNLEMQFVQSQKMQAVGQLAGGIAHDFNNLLTAMIGFCDLLLLRFRPGDQSFNDIMQIKQNANRAASLVRQLLAFSRQQTLQPRVIDIGEVVTELSHLLNRLLGETVDLRLVLGRDLAPVKVDPGQLEQVIINLAVNARDAMPDGGTLTIRTENEELAEPEQHGAEALPAGQFVRIDVADTGTGIEPEILERIFEPFFSTKPVGSGTGLGLSMVYGIVKQTGGSVLVHSAVGEGTRFSIYLPRFYPTEDTVPARAPELPPAPPRDLTGEGTILLVEDEAPVRMFTTRALQNKGYTVLEAKSGAAALEILDRRDTPQIDLIITDVVMPQMDGPTLIEHVRQRLPLVKVIFISGYAEDTLTRRLGAGDDVHFLAKPYSLKDIALKVKDIINRADTAVV